MKDHISGSSLAAQFPRCSSLPYLSTRTGPGMDVAVCLIDFPEIPTLSVEAVFRLSSMHVAFRACDQSCFAGVSMCPIADFARALVQRLSTS